MKQNNSDVQQVFFAAGRARWITAGNVAKPLAPLEAYEAWLSANYNVGLTHANHISRASFKVKINGRMLRRMVQMRRDCCSYNEIGQGVGLADTRVRAYLISLPEELAP